MTGVQTCALPIYNFVYVRLNMKYVCAGWCHNILAYCQDDEEKALATFFDLYQEFIHIRMKHYWKAVLTKENIERNDKVEHCRVITEHGAEPVYKSPIAVYVLELTIPSYMLVVEAVNEVYTKTLFFSSAEDAKGNSGAETYFGKINEWKKFEATNLFFDKVIKIC